MHSESSSNVPHSSDPNGPSRFRSNEEKDNISVASKEITSEILEISINKQEDNDIRPLPVTSNETPCINNIQSTSLAPVKTDIIKDMSNKPFYIYSNLPSPKSLSLPAINEPQTLLIQALAKLNENIPLHLQNLGPNCNIFMKPSEISAPDSLASAPPSYSFVLRQMAARRPRLMGRFIPSPSFIQHTPPPNYATAFDIYVDTPIPPPPTRVHHFGFTPILVACPECGYTGMTVVASKITLSTHLCAMILCLLCCWACAPLPYVLRSCKDVYHYCRNCRNFLGMYCPTNPENVYN